MSASTGIELHIENTIATLTLNLPQRHNALAAPQLKSICHYLQRVESDNTVRVLIITGRGDKTFCAGAALDELHSGAITGDVFAQMTDQLAALSIPTICAFNGSAYGGGVEIGLACDFRIGIDNMRLFVPPARIGLCYPVNGIERFVSILGVNVAKRLLLASEEFTGAALLHIGYLTHLVDAESLQATAQTLAERMAAYAPVAVKSMKSICNHAASGTLDKIAANEVAQLCNASEDLQEGFLAMKEKRAPNFKGC